MTQGNHTPRLRTIASTFPQRTAPSPLEATEVGEDSDDRYPSSSGQQWSLDDSNRWVVWDPKVP
ncbi:MAG: hypothetical protein ACO3EZ_13465, partial [Prochlorotrichaceae cyanobacterium]